MSTSPNVLWHTAQVPLNNDENEPNTCLVVKLAGIDVHAVKTLLCTLLDGIEDVLGEHWIRNM